MADKIVLDEELEKDVQIQEGIRKTSSISYLGHPNFPNKAYPGYAVDYPTCSPPSSEGNRGCDAFAVCTTKGQGPYAVAFFNPKNMKTSCHCRDWMRRLQFKNGYRAVDNEWEPFKEHIAVDPQDKRKGIRVRSGKIKILNVKNPNKLRVNVEQERHIVNPEYDDVEVSEVLHGDPGTGYTSLSAGAEGSVGDTGNRKGRGRPKRDDEGSGGSGQG